MHAFGAARQIVRLGDGDEEPEVGEVVVHRSLLTNAVLLESQLFDLDGASIMASLKPVCFRFRFLRTLISGSRMPWKHWSNERLGVALAVLAAFGFSFKAIFVKLAYAVAPVEAVTLLALRMAFSLPVFLWVGLVESRSAPALSRRDWGALVALGLLGYYASSMFDFLGLQYISAGLERLILFTYPTLTVLIGVLFLGSALGLLMRPISERLTLYGRERVGVLLLCALALRLLWRNDFFPIDSLWIGWVAPGLIAADVQRQGVLPTLSGAVSCGIGTAMVMGVLVSLYGVFA